MAWTVAVVSTAGAFAQRIPADMKVEDIYKNYCASCHGDNLQGASGSSLIDGEWKLGASDEDIAKVISKGIPNMGMEGFGKVMSPEQIRSLVVFMREKERQEKFRHTDLPRPQPGKVTKTDKETYETQLVTEGLTFPWGLAFLPDGNMLVTEKRGTLRLVDKDGKLDPQPIENTPKVLDHGQGGLMDVAVHPDYAKNGWVYLAYTDGTRDDGVKALTAIVRGRIKDHKWVDEETIYRADKKFYTGDGVHFGSRMVFDKGYIYFAIGERGGRMQAQEVTNPKGKIFRLYDDGRVPLDNPFVNKPGAEKGIWTYGHRNPQGLAMDRTTGQLFDTEHGPRGGDEFNLLLKGHNYGWPVITWGMDYPGTPITSDDHGKPLAATTEKEGMDQPLTKWVPSIATCGLAWYDGDKFPEWKGDFFAGGLAGQQVDRIRVKDGKVVEQEIVLKGMGRIRDVRSGPDGFIYLITNDPNRIVRLVPAKKD